jgi:hypothetical protein
MSEKPTPPTLSQLIRSVALRDRLQVDPSASTKDLSNALHALYRERDEGESTGGTRVVRNPAPTVSDLIRKWRALPDDVETGST